MVLSTYIYCRNVIKWCVNIFLNKCPLISKQVGIFQTLLLMIKIFVIKNTVSRFLSVIYPSLLNLTKIWLNLNMKCTNGVAAITDSLKPAFHYFLSHCYMDKDSIFQRKKEDWWDDSSWQLISPQQPEWITNYER